MLSNVRANGPLDVAAAEQTAWRMAPRRGSQRVGLLKCLERAMTRDLIIAGTLVSLVALALYGVLWVVTRAATDQRTIILRPTPPYRKNFLHAKFLTIDDSIGLVATSNMDSARLSPHRDARSVELSMLI